jgi:hypothetical protein
MDQPCESVNGHKEWWTLTASFIVRMDQPLNTLVEIKLGTLTASIHREDGPAIDYTNGYKAWNINGKLHREDGPAVEDTDGYTEWWIDGESVTEEEFNTRMKKNTEHIKGMVTEVSISSDSPNWNPMFNSIKVGPDDESAGSFLKITADDERNDGSCISLDWNEWDSLVAVVAKYREDWEWKD